MKVNLAKAHGTRTPYRRGCRCIACRASEAERSRRYAASHSDSERVRRRIYYEAHREERLEWARRYAEVHREDRARNWAQWYADHREEQSDQNRAKRSRRREAVGSHSAADIRGQHKRQHGRCFWCNAKVGRRYHIDHVVPISKGGSDGPENLVVSCPLCNLRKKDKHPMDFAGVLL